MAGATTTSTNALLFERVMEAIEDTNEKEATTYDRLEKVDVEDANPRGVRMSVQVEDNASQRWSSVEGFDYAPSDAGVYQPMTVTYTRVSKTCEFSKDVMQLDKAANRIVPLVATEVSNATMKLKKDLNRYLFGDGSGELARVSGIAANVITFNTTGNLFGSTKFDKRARIQWYNPALTTQRVGGGVNVSTVTAVDKANKTATLDNVPSDLSTASTGDVAVIEGSVNSVIRGIDYFIANSGSVQGLSRATYPSLNATVVSAASTGLSVSLLANLFYTMAYKTGKLMGGKGGWVFIMSPAQASAYEALGLPFRQLQGQKLDFAFTDLSYRNVPIIVEPDCPDGTVYLVNFSALKRFRLKVLGPERVPGTDTIFHLRNANAGNGHQDGVNVYLTAKEEIGSANPKMVGAKLTTISISGLPSRHAA